MRRILFYWHILNRDKDELLSKFYTVQRYSPSKGDWVHQIQKDMTDLKMQQSEDEIRSMSNYKFKKIVKEKIARFAISILETNKKKKSLKLNIDKFVPKEYILSKNLSKSEVQTLFKVRNYMIEVKDNFRSSHENIWCRLCLIFCESQDHLLVKLFKK